MVIAAVGSWRWHMDRTGEAYPNLNKLPLVLRSLDAVGEGVASVAWGGRWAAPHPRAGAGIELTGRHPGGQRDLLGSDKRLAGKGLAAKQPPPALLQIQPAGALGDEHLADAGMVAQPGTSRVAVVAGEVVGDHHNAPVGVGGLDRGQQLLVAGRVA